MKIKEFDPIKLLFLDLINILDIDKMKEDIKASSNPLIQNLWRNLIQVIEKTEDPDYKTTYFNVGICGIYTLLDPVYSQPLRFILESIKNSDLGAEPPRLWRVNNLHEKTERRERIYLKTIKIP